jgi:hypothetical protein
MGKNCVCFYTKTKQVDIIFFLGVLYMQISLIWHETIQFIDTDRKVVIVNMDPNLKLKWEVKLQDPSTYSIAETGYKVEIVQGHFA